MQFTSRNNQVNYKVIRKGKILKLQIGTYKLDIKVKCQKILIRIQVVNTKRGINPGVYYNNIVGQ